MADRLAHRPGRALERERYFHSRERTTEALQPVDAGIAGPADRTGRRRAVEREGSRGGGAGARPKSPGRRTPKATNPPGGARGKSKPRPVFHPAPAALHHPAIAGHERDTEQMIFDRPKAMPQRTGRR